MSAADLAPRQRWLALAQGLQQDLKDYAALRQLLAQQYQAALRHDAAAMQQLAQAISSLADRLHGMREQRVGHAQALLPGQGAVSMLAVIALLQPPLRAQFEQLWQRLLELVQACKQDNLRNGQLIAEQAEIMQTAVFGKAQDLIYAPL